MHARTKRIVRRIAVLVAAGAVLFGWRFCYYPRHALRLGMTLGEVRSVSWGTGKLIPLDMALPEDELRARKYPVYYLHIWHMGVDLFLNLSKEVVRIDYLFGKSQRIEGYATGEPARIYTEDGAPLSTDTPQQ